ncbi:MAG: DUF222 domain-containing protein [Acidimicrobiia bacterium]
MGNLASAIDELAAEDLDDVAPGAVGDDIVELARERERLDAQLLRRLHRFDASGAWAEDGSLSTRAWLRRHCRIAPGPLAERVRVARRLHDSLPETRAAFAAGEIGYAHVRVIAATVDASDACEETIGEAEPILIDVARDCDPVGLRRVAEHWKHTVDAEGFRGDEHDRYQRRRLHVSSTFQGMVAGDFELEAEGGATVITAVDAYAKPRAGGDPRTPAQRRADALVEICRHALDRGDAPMTGGERPHVTVMLPLDTLEGRAGAPAAEVGRIAQPISGEAARRLACDCGISRIITDGASEPLDIGRRTRVIPPALRRAVIARDRHCVAPAVTGHLNGATSTIGSTGSMGARPSSPISSSAVTPTTTTNTKPAATVRRPEARGQSRKPFIARSVSRLASRSAIARRLS